jgi:hypothetical protein
MAVHKYIVFSSSNKDEAVKEEKRRIKMYGTMLANSQGNSEELRKRLGSRKGKSVLFPGTSRQQKRKLDT